MAKKVLTRLMVIGLVFLFSSCSGVGAEELVSLQKIRKRPVNVLEYAETSIDIGGTMLSKLLKTMDPVGLYNGKEKHGLGGAKITLLENFLHPKLNFIGGVTLKNKEPSRLLLGVELKLNLKGDLGKALSRFRPAILWSDDKWWFGVSLELRKPHI